MTYDSKNNMLTNLCQNWINNIWENFEKYQITYAENMNGVSVEYFKWIDENWIIP